MSGFGSSVFPFLPDFHFLLFFFFDFFRSFFDPILFFPRFLMSLISQKMKAMANGLEAIVIISKYLKTHLTPWPSYLWKKAHSEQEFVLHELHCSGHLKQVTLSGLGSRIGVGKALK
jgi:hypothetical protein